MSELNRSSVENEYTILLEYDSSNNPIFLGEANIGVLASEAKWRIRKLFYDSSNNVTAIKWANASMRYEFVWNDRATYTYS